ncbi:hypothetical protein ACFSHQ_03050 [Gemmobacter lanyuensis]
MTARAIDPGALETTASKSKYQNELSMALVLVGIAIMFEILGWIFVGIPSLRTSSGCRSSSCRYP